MNYHVSTASCLHKERPLKYLYPINYPASLPSVVLVLVLVIVNPAYFWHKSQVHELQKTTVLPFPASLHSPLLFLINSDFSISIETFTANLNNSMAENNGERKDEIIAPESAEVQPPKKKPFSFYLAFLAINISTFIVSLDATALAVAIPVS